MGYTTEFSGAFKLDRKLAPEHAAYLRAIANECDEAGAPDSYCQWVPTRQLDGIEWDNGEKFYHYTEWLQWLIDNPLKRWGYTLSGSVTWHGDESGDTGLLSVVDGKAIAEQFKPATSSERIAGLRGCLQAIVDAVARYGSDAPELEEIRDLAAYGQERDDALKAGRKFMVFEKWRKSNE